MSLPLGLSVERIHAMYQRMLLMRAFDEHAGLARRENRLRGSVHEYTGQEAIAAGVCAMLRPADYISSYHRGHGHCIAKGADPAAMMLEIYGKAGGVCGGKGGSMHVADFSLSILGANGVVADGVTIAVGAAQAVRLLGEERIVVAFFGDGALNRGPMLEALNWAKVYDLPILFVCEDNGYSDHTRTASVTAGPGIVARAEAFGIPADSIDGNDLLAVACAAALLVGEVRTGKGPRFLHATTCRWRGHLALDRGLYRDPEEVAGYAAQDPIARIAGWLLDNGVAQATLDGDAAAAAGRIADAVALAEAAPCPDEAQLFTDVQDAGASSWA
ncbi:MAG: thiamine pyrophosphate-dependent dehydrogenase E1 component subunit alpha [bacterium]|jgi:pyruvate dehydrogenase E1 component alpha subunit|nr:thiamine pyrophosphate-dependent dehydrogenase E1 component subunit alpha [Betaproteobacteria bacterium]